MVDIGWDGQIFHQGNVCQHLGYPIVDVSSSQSLNWMSSTILDNFMYRKSQAWPFSTRLKVVQAIMIPMISYFLPLLLSGPKLGTSFKMKKRVRSGRYVGNERE